MKTSRLHNLDYLRGLAAFGIMTYHFLLFGYGLPSPDLFITRLGLYGVSVFYVLSGLTLFHVYCKSMEPNREDLIDFFLKRGFRIFPLLWVVTFSTMVLRWDYPGEAKLLLNLTGLFGLIAPAEYIGTGVWSIGNELVFYLFFPLFMLLYRKHKALLALMTVLLTGLYFDFAFLVLPGLGTMANAWTTYINPLNQAFLFLAGFLVGVLFEKREFNNLLLLSMLVGSLLIFTFYPIYGGAINLVTGSRRIIFSVVCVGVCLAAYKITYQLPKVLDRGLGILGEISYSLYLLHPIVWFTIEKLSSKYYVLPLEVRVMLCTMLSLVFSLVSFQYLEQYFARIGRKVSARLLSKPQQLVAN